ncbi:uncharacterized protein PHACADRAFT_189717 [Phanerochaete carnosa HHB-10118-sp]|uniref:Uncharacterized protein n=1 Tax=Phanerochaete carnosa (strain HHB-10118-sp) TaxID=650164 RepID=K5WMB7_PHACS|nr:uncharacterized protein PHACADRAFT_189717 [Phanerochaete carnosa HHB-10118-sp]EKM60590.1 hypothetical protein PHACADRAFT_189717 [Phanerochaete carnosa HHB-10118-sp]
MHVVDIANTRAQLASKGLQVHLYQQSRPQPLLSMSSSPDQDPSTEETSLHQAVEGTTIARTTILATTPALHGVNLASTMVLEVLVANLTGSLVQTVLEREGLR